MPDRVNLSIKAAVQKFNKENLKQEDLAVALLDLDNQTASGFRQDIPLYPASLVKLFYLVYAHRLLEDDKISNTPELKRALQDMIVVSDDDPSHYVVDILTETTGGPELSEKEMSDWVHKRNAVNRYFSSIGYDNINVCQKTYANSPYGREKAFYGPNNENANRLTAASTAKILNEIVQGKAVTVERSKQMMDLLHRDISKKPKNNTITNPFDQSNAFIGSALPPEAKLWSKAGWTSKVRHDAAYIELGGKHFILVILTLNHADNLNIIPFIADQIIGKENSF